MNTMDKLSDILVDRGLTLTALCRMTGLTRSAFSNAKKRDNQLRIDTIEMVCDALNMPLYEFFMSDADWAELDRLWTNARRVGQHWTAANSEVRRQI